jgi:hypothetical protein
MMRTKLALAFAGAVAVCFAGSVAATGCSSSSSSGSAVDAAFDPSTFDAAGAIGVGLANCVTSSCLSNDLCGDSSVVNCPSPGLCGGTLIGANAPISYCTLACTTNADCPASTVCETKETHGHCLRSCTSNADCSGGFGCTLDAGASGNVCWSPYTGADQAPDAGEGSEGGPEAAPPSEAGADGPDTTPEAASPEASSPEAGDAGATAADAADGGTDGAGE